MPYIFRLLLFVVGFYFLGYLIFRIIIPRLLKWFIKRKLKQRGFDFNEKKEPKKRKEGEIDIDHIPDKKENKTKSKDGEYIDYEEL